MELSRITGSIPSNPGLEPSRTNQAETKANIGEAFKTTLQNLSAVENNADQLMQKLATGEDVEIHEVMLAMEEADISFRVTMAVRDKLLESYQEIMRMQV